MAESALKIPEGADITPTDFEAVLCANILNWLDDVAARRFENDVAAVLCFLIDAANATSKEMKREMFTVIRCIHCSQHCPRGGDKKERTLQLKAYQIQWLSAVQKRCHHSSVQKTVRILCDFYYSIAGRCRTQAGVEFCPNHEQCVTMGETTVFDNP
mmetsp:Transcript_55514/g.89937  ORF Transcript_55514/g.89937 Transcript_55514/m.89937 type:complete len:157 (-) Transcript_55514:48-518(-)